MKALRILSLIFGCLLTLGAAVCALTLSATPPIRNDHPWWNPDRILSGWTRWSEVWQTAVVLLVATILVPLLIELIKEIQPRERAENRERYFPFTIYSTKSSDDMEALKQRFLKEHASLPYQPRVPAEHRATLERKLRSPFLLLTGRTGLGKTRECIELFLRLTAEKQEEFTILYPHDDFDRPSERDIPEGFSPRNIILFIDDIHALCGATSRPRGREKKPERGFHERLASVIEWLKDRFPGQDYRVILTSRDETELRHRIRLDAVVWEDFEIYQLPGLHSAMLPEFIRAVGSHYRLTLDEAALAQIARVSDRTLAGIINALSRESPGPAGPVRVLTLNNVKNYSFKYPLDWEEKVYRDTIEPHVDRRAVFEALSVCQHLRIPPQRAVVVELALEFLAGHKSRRLFRPLDRRRIRRTIRRDLCAWMFETQGEVICPSAYTEDRVEISTALPNVIAASQRLVRAQKGSVVFEPDALAFQIAEFGDPKGAFQFISFCEKYHRSSRLLIAKSLILTELGRDLDSEEAAKQACALQPGNAKYLIVLSNAYSRLRRHEKALDAAHQAVLAEPEVDEAWLNYGVVQSKQGKHAEAIKSLNEACRLNPRSAPAWSSLGVAYDLFGDYKHAIAACSRATDLDPRDAESWHNLGIAFDRAGKPENAIRALTSAVQLNENDGSAWLSLARAHSRAGDRQKAIDALEHAVERLREGRDFERLISAGKGYGKLDDAQTALDISNEVLEQLPEFTEALMVRAFSLYQLGLTNEAEEARGRLADHCRNSEDWHRLSVVYQHANLAAEAINAARRAVELDGANVRALWRLAEGLVRARAPKPETFDILDRLRSLLLNENKRAGAPELARLGGLYGRVLHPRAAVELAREAIQSDPECADAVRTLAMNLSNLPECEDEARAARDQFESICASADDWASLSILRGRCNELQKAIDAARECLALDPAHFRAARSLAINLERTGRTEEAQAARLAEERLCTTGVELLQLSATYEKTGYLKDALRAVDRAIQFKPQKRRGWIQRANILKELSNSEPEYKAQLEETNERIEELNALKKMGPPVLEAPGQVLGGKRKDSHDADVSLA